MVYSIMILLLGIFGMFTPGYVTPAGGSGANDDTVESAAPEARGTAFNGFVQLWDHWDSTEHDGLYGDGDDGDDYDFYLGTELTGIGSNQFRIYLKNIMTEGIMLYVNTTLELTTTGSNPSSGKITITDPYFNRTNVLNSTNFWNSNNNWYDYGIEIGTNAKITSYQLKLHIHIDMEVNSIKSSTNGYLDFMLLFRSRLAPYGGFMLSAVDQNKNTEPLYSGAKNQFVAITGIDSEQGTLDDVTFTIDKNSFSLPFTLMSNSASVNDVNTWTTKDNEPMWKMTDAGPDDTVPQDYSGIFDVTYTHTGTEMNEMDLPLIIDIARTPIVSLSNQVDQRNIGDEVDEKFITNKEIYQGTTDENFELEFKNEGNIDLENVEVELYTDNAAYFFKSKFYYDENNMAFKNTYGKIVNLGDINIGETATGTFPTSIIKNLPPGLYKIPMRYDAEFNPGGIFNTEFDENWYHSSIVSARDDYNEGYTPFLLVTVLPGDDENDLIEPDLQAFSVAELQPGMKNVQVIVLLTNLENYQVMNSNAQIATGGTSPLQPPGDDDRTAGTVNAIESDFTMYAANDPVFSNQQILNLFIDVYKDALPGVYDVPITVTCLDPFNVERTTTVNVKLIISPVPPQLMVSDVSTTEIQPNGDFNVTVKVQNIGGSDASNVSLMFNGTSNLFSAKGTATGPSTIAANGEGTYKFVITAGEVEQGTTYVSSILASFKDPVGNIFSYDPDTQQVISFFVEEAELPPPPPMLAISDITAVEILPNEQFTITVKVFNYGGSDAKNVMVMFNGSSNLFSASQSVQGPKDIDINSVVDFDFTITAGDVEDGMTYTSTIIMRYEGTDDEPLAEEEPIDFRVKEKEIKVKEPEKELITTPLAVVIFGILILIAVIISGFIYYKVSTKVGKVEDKIEEYPPEQGPPVLEPELESQPELPPAEAGPPVYQPVVEEQPPPDVDITPLPPAPQPQPSAAEPQAGTPPPPPPPRPEEQK
jgi:hypothetical protein